MCGTLWHYCNQTTEVLPTLLQKLSYLQNKACTNIHKSNTLDLDLFSVNKIRYTQTDLIVFSSTQHHVGKVELVQSHSDDTGQSLTHTYTQTLKFITLDITWDIFCSYAGWSLQCVLLCVFLLLLRFHALMLSKHVPVLRLSTGSRPLDPRSLTSPELWRKTAASRRHWFLSTCPTESLWRFSCRLGRCWSSAWAEPPHV